MEGLNAPCDSWRKEDVEEGGGTGWIGITGEERKVGPAHGEGWGR